MVTKTAMLRNLQQRMKENLEAERKKAELQDPLSNHSALIGGHKRIQDTMASMELVLLTKTRR